MADYLETLTIKGFKSIRELDDFKLNNLNIFIGGNGAGKSNLIEFFRLVSAMMKVNGLKEYVEGRAYTYLFGGAKQTKNISVKMQFGQNGYDFELAPTQDGFFLINNEQRHYFPKNTTRNLGSGNFNPELLIDKDNSELTNEQGENGASWDTYNTICSWKIYHFHDTGSKSGMRLYQDQGHNEALSMDASNIAPYLLELKKNYYDNYKEIINAVQLVIPFFEDFILKPNSQELLRLNWRQKGLNDYPMRPDLFSDGSIRFICLATALLQPNPPSTIIIDEPELELHPSAIAILAELIQSASRRTQLIVATQSPALINYFGIEDIIVVNRKDGASTFERLNEEDYNVWLEDYSVGELWTKNVIAGGPVYE